MTATSSVYNAEWKVEEAGLALKSASRIWVLASIVIPFFALFEYRYSIEQFQHFLYIFLSVSCLMILVVLYLKKFSMPSFIQIYGVSVILAGCFSYMAAKTNINNVHNYLMGVSAITLVRGMIYFGKVVHLVVVTLFNHALAFSLFYFLRSEPIASIPDIESTMFFGIIFMIFSFAGMSIRYQLTRENFINSLKLQKSFEVIEEQKKQVDKAHSELHEKHEETMASIRYAKRIQDAMLTRESYINRELNRLLGGSKPPKE